MVRKPFIFPNKIKLPTLNTYLLKVLQENLKSKAHFFGSTAKKHFRDHFLFSTKK